MELKQRIKNKVRGQGNDAEVTKLRAEVKQLRRRVSGLTEDVQEARRLHERVAELTDAVAELLVPAMDRDDERVKKAVATFNRTGN